MIRINLPDARSRGGRKVMPRIATPIMRVRISPTSPFSILHRLTPTDLAPSVREQEMLQVMGVPEFCSSYKVFDCNPIILLNRK